ncbi:hypothetical protein GCM10018772_15150 [Streptomyces fumanus]|uniref:Uncharacterized protein n=1 Tax=Streptomyces fumanus TaxID=67302 RepID=A0A919A9K5_9ACTN|nr:hypothetical protein GCM10018772_15150 [Streptomyces fumanus]
MRVRTGPRHAPRCSRAAHPPDAPSLRWRYGGGAAIAIVRTAAVPAPTADVSPSSPPSPRPPGSPVPVLT